MSLSPNPSDLQVFTAAPEDFQSAISVSACYLWAKDLVLMLKRSPGKYQGDRWGVPAGKIEPGEAPLAAACRELQEETGIVADPTQMKFLTTIWMRRPEVEYVYHVFELQADRPLEVCLNHEHQDFCWATEEDLQKLPLMIGAQEGLDAYRVATQATGSPSIGQP
ncbi:MAG: NUDIX hydrolase [Chlamydiia bacterium]